MKRFLTTHLCLIGLLALGTTTAMAQQQSDSSPPAKPRSPADQQSDSSGLQADQFIQDFDDDGDGALARRELPPRMRSEFDRLNRNDDDKLTKRELQQHGRRAERRRPMQPIEFIYVWVSDADLGHLSLNEVQRAYDTLQKIDKNGDGELTRSEVKTCRKANLAKWARMVTKRLDDNDDNQVSEQEAQGTFLTSRFDDIDDNGDGSISRKELQQCVMKQHGMSGGSQNTRTGRRNPSDNDAR
ncbi:MAG: hypothetical protein DWQ37_16350 [Planctomycetota bacterium]|nr:MAG: hypothetical protein DWQ37_16350 [Planctomycetota bacterium]